MSVSATVSGLQAGVTFHYTLCAMNAYGTKCDLTDHTFVTNNPPIATLKENVASPGERQVSFDGSQSTDSDGSIVSWTLTFGDGTTSGVVSGAPPANIVHTYASAGSYVAKLTVTDNGGATSLASQITVVVPSIAVADASVTEGQTANFVVTLSAVSGHAVTVDYTTADGTAGQPGDYTKTQGTLTIQPGQCGPSSTACQISVPTVNDTLYENNETFTLNLSNPTGAAIGDGTATGTILPDNDPQPVVMIANNARPREQHRLDGQRRPDVDCRREPDAHQRKWIRLERLELVLPQQPRLDIDRSGRTVPLLRTGPQHAHGCVAGGLGAGRAVRVPAGSADLHGRALQSRGLRSRSTTASRTGSRAAGRPPCSSRPSTGSVEIPRTCR